MMFMLSHYNTKLLSNAGESAHCRASSIDCAPRRITCKMPIGPRCHELRVNDEDQTWRIVYRIDTDAIVIGDVFEKKNQPDAETRDQRLPATLEAL